MMTRAGPNRLHLDGITVQNVTLHTISIKGICVGHRIVRHLPHFLEARLLLVFSLLPSRTHSECVCLSKPRQYLGTQRTLQCFSKKFIVFSPNFEANLSLVSQ